MVSVDRWRRPRSGSRWAPHCRQSLRAATRRRRRPTTARKTPIACLRAMTDRDQPGQPPAGHGHALSRSCSRSSARSSAATSELPSQREPAGVVDDVELRSVGDLDLAGGVRRDEVAHAERIGDGAQVVGDVGGERVATLDEAADVVGEHRRVTVRIDGDHRHADLVGIVAELAQRRAHVGHRRRADVGAVGVAEVDDEQSARLGAERERLTALLRSGNATASTWGAGSMVYPTSSRPPSLPHDASATSMPRRRRRAGGSRGRSQLADVRQHGLDLVVVQGHWPACSRCSPRPARRRDR